MTDQALVLNYSSLSRRALALVLDSIILAIPCAVMGHIIPVLGGLVVAFFYAPVLESSEIRATIGKSLMGIQVTDMNGGRISFRAALIRNILKAVSSLLLFLGFVVALFTEKKQTLHDLIADTLVVYGRSPRPIGDAWMSCVRELFNMEASPVSELERLQALRDRGALTEEEFQEQKRKILSRER